MKKDLFEDSIVLHITGVDRPGVTSTIAEIVAEESGTLLDIGQTVLHGHLTLSAIVGLSPRSGALRRILFSINKLGLRVEVAPFQPATSGPSAAPDATSLCVTLLGDLTNGRAVFALTKFFAARELNIREIRRLTDQGLSGLEFIVDLPAHLRASESETLSQLRGEILTLAQDHEIDMAVQKDDIFRQNKRLICFDVDSTFIQMEVIDEIARIAGAGEKVAAITERAMRGELDFKQSLHERVACLKGLPFSKTQELLSNIPLMPGAENLIRKLQSIGLKIGLVSGGFDFMVNELKNRFNLNFAFSNQLEVEGGVLTGRVIGGIVDAERKAQVLRDMSHVFGCHPEQTVAVGDGANDILMLQAAGLGIAFHAKPKLQKVADLSLNRGALDSVLLMMGFREKDLRSI